MRYAVIATLGKDEYMVTLEANSRYAAEHAILDKGICGRHSYGVTGCMAFAAEDMKTDTFIHSALQATTVTLKELEGIIEARNMAIKTADHLEETLQKMEKERKNIEKALQDMADEKKGLEAKLDSYLKVIA